LPRTLDETYERIFLGIPDDDKLFVHHVLRWIYYYNDWRTVYRPGNFPCSILLQATERSTSHLSHSQEDFLYDEEALRELCGCLIVIRSEDLFHDKSVTALTASFAHYTVLEFLQSARISNSPIAFFRIEKESTVVEFTRITLIETMEADSNTLGHKEYYNDPGAVAHTVAQDFNSYCAASAVISINFWTPYLNDKDDIVNLVFDMMNPSKPHFERLCDSLEIMQNSLLVFAENGVDTDGQFWVLDWIVPPANMNSAILLGLSSIKNPELLFSKAMNKVNIEVLFEEEVVVVAELHYYTNNSPVEFGSRRIKGLIVDAIAQLIMCRSSYKSSFSSLLDYGERHPNASTTLLSYIGSHGEYRNIYGDCGETCSLTRLLQLGARPDAPGYSVKPLQIAVVSWDFEGVEILLQAGADPNDCGYENGITWEDSDLLGLFNYLRGCSPLFICREFKCIGYDKPKTDRIKIEELLVAYEARSFKQEWACGGLEGGSSEGDGVRLRRGV
jgi:hypothetical protein